MASMRTASTTHSERQAPSGPPSQAASRTSLAQPYPAPAPYAHYPVPRAAPHKSPFGRRARKAGRGRAWVFGGVVQVVVGGVCFILALVGMSVSTTGDAYSAGLAGGIVFVAAGVLSCLVGVSDADCLPMTCLVLNLLAAAAALLSIALSGWEIHGMGSPTRVLSSEDFMTVKCVLVMMGCVAVFFLSLWHAYRLKGAGCCSCEKRAKPSGGQPRGYPGPMDCLAPAVSNTTTNSSWNWNVQHAVNPGRPAPVDPALQQPYLQQRYLAQMQVDRDAIPVEAYTHRDDPLPAIHAVPARYDPASDADVHIQPAYI